MLGLLLSIVRSDPEIYPAFALGTDPGNYNSVFYLVGEYHSPDGYTLNARLAADGFQVTLRMDNIEDTFIAFPEPPFVVKMFGNDALFELGCATHTFGGILIASLILTSHAPGPVAIDLGTWFVFPTFPIPSPDLYHLPDGTGILSSSPGASIGWWVRGHPLIRNVTTYFGGSQWTVGFNIFTQSIDFDEDEFAGKAAAFSWQDIAIAPGERQTFTFMVTTGLDAVPPALDLTGTDFARIVMYTDLLTVTGTATSVSGANVYVIATINEDPATLFVVADQVASGDSFTHEFTLKDRGFVNQQTIQIDVYAVDPSGSVSDPTSYRFYMVGPTREATLTPVKTASESMSPSPTASVSITDTPAATFTPPPSFTPMTNVVMLAEQASAPGFFDPLGSTPARTDPMRSVSSTGITARYWIDGVTDAAYRIMLNRVHDAGGIAVWANATAIGPIGVFSITAVNHGQEAVSMDFALDADDYLDGSWANLFQSFGDWDGFFIKHDAVEFYIFCRRYPLITDADAYWYGKYQHPDINPHFLEMTDQKVCDCGDGQFAISWSNRAIAPGEKKTFSVVMSWNEPKTVPQLTITLLGPPTIYDWTATLTFATTAPTGSDLASIWAVLDHDVTDIREVWNVFSRPLPNALTFPLQDWPVPDGDHTLEFYGFSQYGAISDPHSFSISVTAPSPTQSVSNAATITPEPTDSPTDSPVRTQTRSALPTARPYLKMRVDIPENVYQEYFHLTGQADDAPDLYWQLLSRSTGMLPQFTKDMASSSWDYIRAGFNGSPLGTSVDVTFTAVAVEAAAIVIFQVENLYGNDPTRFHICLPMDLSMAAYDGPPTNDPWAWPAWSEDSPAIYDVGDGAGVQINAVALRAKLQLRHAPLVTDVTTYWFGRSEDELDSHWVNQSQPNYTGEEASSVTLSWQDQEIAPGETMTLSFIAMWGSGSSPPSLQVTAPALAAPVHFEQPFPLSITVTGSASGTGSLIAVFDDNLLTLYPFREHGQFDSPFEVDFKLEDAGIIAEGDYSMDIYAFDATGEVSNRVHFNVTCIGPTPMPTWTPSHSPSESGSPKPSPTMTHPATSTPSMSPYGDIEMAVSADVDSKTNFRLQGIRRGNPASRIDISSRGFDSSWKVSTLEAGGNSTSGIFSRLSSLEALGLQLGTNVEARGSTAVVQFIVTNPLTESRNVSIVLSTNVLLDESRRVQIRNENNASSFRVMTDLIHFQVFARNYPLVVDVDSYWFGAAAQFTASAVPQVPVNEAYNGDSAAFALSWQDRTVPPRTRIVLSALMSWGEVSNPPNASIDRTTLPPDNAEMAWDKNVSFEVKIDPATTASIAEVVVYLVVDGEVVQEFRPDANGGFTISFSPAALQLTGGSHVFQIYAVDAVGSIAPIASFSNEVLAPTLPQTRTPIATETPTASPTESASWGAIVDLPWYNDPGIEGAEEGVNSVTVGKIVIGVGIPIGIILVIAFGFLINRYQRALRADMSQRLKESSASELGSTGTGV